MRVKLITLAIVTGAALTLILMIGLAGADGPKVSETNLNPSGTVYEINPDAQGNLWVTDNGADEIRQVNPATGVYTIYHNMDHANDARMDAAGNVWWTDYQNARLGRIAVSASTLTTWSFAEGTGPVGIAFDDAGHVWVSDESGHQVYRVDPATDQICAYLYPGAGDSDYLTWYAGSIWLTDGDSARLVKLNPSSNVFTIWQMAASAHPEGLTVDEDRNFWLSDQGTPAGLAHFEPAIDRLTFYTLPVNTTPEVVSINKGNVWYAGNTERVGTGSLLLYPTVGVLSPTAASGITFTLPVTTTLVTPACSTSVRADSSVTTSIGNITWTSNVYTRSTPSAGWTVYQLPAGASPWGIVARGGRVWFTDQGRQVLAQMNFEFQVYMPIIMRQ